MITLLGASGYIGEAFALELKRRGTAHESLSRGAADYSRFEVFLKYLRDRRPEFVINAAGYTGKPNVDACEVARADTLQGNTLLAQTIAQACAAAEVPWGHVSSGCIYSGAKINTGGKVRAEKDMNRPDMKALVEKDPAAICTGLQLTDVPELHLSRSALQFLQRDQGAGRGSDCWRGP